MRQKLIGLLAFLAVSLLLTGTINAQPTVPVLRPNQHVYFIPEGFAYPGVEAPGLAQLETELATLRYPFYVVFLRELSQAAQQDPHSQAAIRETAQAIDSIAARWLASAPSLFTEQANLMVIIQHPRKVSLLAGTSWVARPELNLGPTNIANYLQPFLGRMHGQPEDPIGGVWETAFRLDRFIFNQVDPSQIQARRRESAELNQWLRDRAEAERRQRTRGTLQEEIVRAEKLRTEPREDLPADLVPQTRALEQAQQVMAQPESTVVALYDSYNTLRRENDSVAGVVEARHHERTWKWVSRFAIGLLIAVMIIGLFYKLWNHRQQVARDRKIFDKAASEWERQLQAFDASRALLDQERPRFRSMQHRTGETAELYQRVAEQVDRIWMLTTALQTHVRHSWAIASAGGFFAPNKFAEALELLEQPFEFQTHAFQAEQFLAMPVIRSIQVVPNGAVSELKSLFKTAEAGWKEVLAAEAIMSEDAPVYDPLLEGLNELRALCTAHHLPEAWLAEHPLTRNTQAALDDLHRLRLVDPLSSLRERNKIKQDAKAIKERLNTLIKITEPVLAHPFTVETNADYVLDEADQPTPLITAVRTAESELNTLLATASNDLTPIKTKVEMVTRLRDALAARFKALKEHCSAAPQEVAHAAHLVEQLEPLVASTAAELTRLATLHPASAVDRSAQVLFGQTVAKARQMLTQAQTELEQKRFLNAERSAKQIVELARDAEILNQKVEANSRQLEQARLNSPDLVDQINTLRTSAVTRQRAARKRIEGARQTHLKITDAEKSLQRSEELLAGADRLFTQATDLINRQLYVAANNQLADVGNELRKAITQAHDACGWCEEQDRLKTEYEQLVRDSGRERAKAESMLSNLDAAHVHLSFHQAPTEIKGPADYADHHRQVSAVHSGWQRQVDEARVAHDTRVAKARQERQRVEAEARHRQEQIETEARHRREEEAASAQRQRDEADRARRDAEDQAQRSRDDSTSSFISSSFTSSSSDTSSSSSSWDSGSSTSSGGSDYGGGGGSNSGGSDY